MYVHSCYALEGPHDSGRLHCRPLLLRSSLFAVLPTAVTAKTKIVTLLLFSTLCASHKWCRMLGILRW